MDALLVRRSSRAHPRRRLPAPCRSLRSRTASRVGHPLDHNDNLHHRDPRAHQQPHRKDGPPTPLRLLARRPPPLGSPPQNSSRSPHRRPALPPGRPLPRRLRTINLLTPLALRLLIPLTSLGLRLPLFPRSIRAG